jgi:hypothetical protein
MFKEILFYILSLIFPSQEEQYTKKYIINTKYLPVEVFWIDNTNVLLSSYGYTLLFNTENRNSSIIDTCENCIYGYDKNFVYCKYINRDIKENIEDTKEWFNKDKTKKIVIGEDKRVWLFKS